MTVIKVKDMHCEKCVARIEKLFKEEQLDFSIDLSNQTVTINGCQHCVKTALDALDDLGFDGVVE